MGVAGVNSVIRSGSFSFSYLTMSTFDIKDSDFCFMLCYLNADFLRFFLRIVLYVTFNDPFLTLIASDRGLTRYEAIELAEATAFSIAAKSYGTTSLQSGAALLFLKSSSNFFGPDEYSTGCGKAPILCKPKNSISSESECLKACFSSPEALISKSCLTEMSLELLNLIGLMATLLYFLCFFVSGIGS